ncbi:MULTISPECIES: glycosyltransferase [Nocardiopsis]|uniref:glycosyltransferase n=1 Tax=Nocardiopsis TaxID=2013 RepID=UPI0003483CB7|nr:MULTISPECIES: glycosyltransferase [Nocardiopsis]
MKIALIAEHTAPLAAHRGEPTCGDSVHVASLSRHLAKLGHRVTVYARKSTSDPVGRSRMGRGVHAEILGAGPERPLQEHEEADHTGAFATALTASLKDDAPDVVHALGWTSGLAALSAVHGAGGLGDVPVVQTFHSLNATEQRAGLPERPERVRLEAAIAGRADAVAVSSADLRFELARMGLPRHRVAVVPFGVDTDHFSVEGGAAAEPWSQRRQDRTRVITVSGPASGGPDRLIDTMVRLPDAELLVVAAAPLEVALDEDARRLELRAKEAGVDDRVHLMGPVERKELPRLLRSADIFASADRYDPYGGAVLEAMACGLPVIARAAGGPTGAVLDRTTGMLLRSARPDTLARAVRGMMNEATTRSAHGIAGADRARSRFTWQRVAAETERVYRTALPGADGLPLAAGDDAH